MGFKVNKKDKDDPDPEKIFYEVEETKSEVATYKVCLKDLRIQRARFQAHVDAIDAKITALEAQ